MQIAVVLGMHKSGTSLVSEILHHSGIEMIEEGSARGYDEGFHHERALTRKINKDLLDAHRRHSLDAVDRIDAEAAGADSVREATNLVSAMSRRGMDWGFKDPRTCLTYDFWKTLLPPHKLICIFRDVAEVHHHYAKVGKESGFRVLNAWFHYNQAMLEAFEGAPESDRLMIRYGSFMEGDEVFMALSSLLNRPLVDRRSAVMRRSEGRRRYRLRFKTGIHRLLTFRSVNRLNDRLRDIAAAETRGDRGTAASPDPGADPRPNAAKA